MLEQRVERVILVEPLGRGLGAHSLDAGDVVRRVADQRQIVDDLFGEDVELRLDADAVESRVLLIVLMSSICGPTSCAMSLSPVEIST
jgi:hypothetical protein